MERTFFSYMYHACLFYTKNQCSSFLHETSPGNQSRLSFRDASLFDAICLQSISSALMFFLIPIYDDDRMKREKEERNYKMSKTNQRTFSHVFFW